VTRTLLSRSKGQRSRSPGRFTHRRVGASGIAAAVGVRTCWPWETAATLQSARRRKGLRRPQGERGGGIPWRRPPTACYAALLPRRGPHIASHSVCPSVCMSVRPVMERHVAPPSELKWRTFGHAQRAA